jgi:hypothetical protein
MSTRELVDTIFGADAGQLKMGLTGRLHNNHMHWRLSLRRTPTINIGVGQCIPRWF